MLGKPMRKELFLFLCFHFHNLVLSILMQVFFRGAPSLFIIQSNWYELHKEERKTKHACLRSRRWNSSLASGRQRWNSCAHGSPPLLKSSTSPPCPWLLWQTLHSIHTIGGDPNPLPHEVLCKGQTFPANTSAVSGSFMPSTTSTDAPKKRAPFISCELRSLPGSPWA
jgi:hypothetical protein